MTFDPRRKYSSEDEKASRTVIWSTKSIDIATEAVSEGGELTHNPFFDKKPELKKGELVFKHTLEEKIEVLRCMENLMYFSRNYAKLKVKDGSYQNVKLYPHQLNQMVAYLEHQHHIQAWSRQASKTTSAAIYMLWEVCFNKNSQIGILANKLDTSKEVLEKIMEIYKRLPFYMKPGLIKCNEKFVKFDNGCSIFAAPCKKDALNGKTIKILYIDEFAFCFDGNSEKQSDFLSNAVPVLAQVLNSRLIITSTPNGKEQFYELYNNAILGKNSYRPSTVYWWQIPGRDEEWARQQIGLIGLPKFKIQFEMSFDTTLNKLLSAATMKQLDKGKQEFKSYDLSGKLARHCDKLRFSPYAKNLRSKKMIALVDLAEGLKGDYTTAHFVSINHRLVGYHEVEIYFKQEFIYGSNDVPLDTEFPSYFMDVCNFFSNELNLKILHEQNTYGDLFVNLLKQDAMSDGKMFSPSYFIKFPPREDAFANRGGNRRVRIGLRTDKRVKRLSVGAFKLAIENDLIELRDTQTIEQVGFFQQNKKGGYEAEIGHDDDVTPYLHLCYAILSRNSALNIFVESYLEEQRLTGRKWRYSYNFSNFRSKIEQDD